MLEHGARRLRVGVRDGLENCGEDLPHYLPILHAKIAGRRLPNRELDLGANQAGAGGEENSWIGLGR